MSDELDEPAAALAAVEKQTKTDSAAPAGSLLAGIEPEPGERLGFSAPAELPALRILHARPSARLWKVWHDTFTICACHAVRDAQTGREGMAYWAYRREHLTTVRGGLMMMEPGEWHITQKIVGQGTFDVLQIDPEHVENVAIEMGFEGSVHLTTASTDNPVLAGAVNALLDAVSGHSDQLMLEHELQRVVGLLVRDHAEHSSKKHPTLNKVQLRRAADYIVEHHADDFGVAALAHASGASVSAICHGLKATLGMTPMELRNLVRLSHAQRLLARGARPVDVSSAVGFCDQAALTRHFKGVWGVTPGEYAHAIRSTRRLAIQ